MRKITGLLIAMGILLIISGCSFYIGSGVVVETEYDLSNFTSVDARSASDVTIVKGDAYSVKVLSDDNTVAFLDISVVGDTLVIDRLPAISITSTTFRTEVTMPVINSLEVCEASTFTMSGFSSVNDFNVDICGAASGSISFISSGNIYAEVREASKLVLVSAAPSGDLDITCSEVGSADFSGCLSEDVRVNVTGASSAWVNLCGSLSGAVAEASKLFYKGTPVLGNVSIDSAASISTY